MNQLSNVSKVIIVAVIAACLIILFVVYGTGGGQNQNVALNPGTSTNATVTAGSPTQTPTPAPAGQSPAKPSPAPVASIKLITPVQGDVWTIAAQNMISWNKEAGVSGDIYLVNAATKAFVGVIIPQLGPHQTSYTWNTRDILLDRTQPTKTTITPGTYILKIAFDGNNVPIITSPAFTITN